MHPPIKKAIFPVAGLGTRFLPATKATPKEMLPIVDKPLIQYAVEEAIAAGIEELIFVTSSSKRAIEDHFDCNFELESILEQRGKYDLLNIVHEVLPANVSCAYIRQPNPLGLGHAILCAKNLVGNQPFAVLLADDLIEEAPRGCLKNMLATYQNFGGSVIAVEPIPLADTKKYGIIATRDNINDAEITNIVEKPHPEHAPSNLAVVGRYILTPGIFPMLEKIGQGSQGEIQLTDGIALLLEKEKAFSHALLGKRYDCGSKIGYLQATVHYALKHPELTDDFRSFLKLTVRELDAEVV